MVNLEYFLNNQKKVLIMTNIILILTVLLQMFSFSGSHQKLQSLRATACIISSTCPYVVIPM